MDMDDILNYSPTEKGEIRPDSPIVRPIKNGANKGLSPLSPLSPAVTLKTNSPRSPRRKAKDRESLALGTFSASLLLEKRRVKEEDAAIRAWLDHIEETDPTIVQCVIDQCSRDAEAKAYFLDHAKQANIEPQSELLPSDSATCKTCKHFQRIDHPHMGHCLGGERNSIALLWDDDARHCLEFETTKND